MECNRAAFLTGSLALASGALARSADAATAPPASATPEMLLGQLMAGNKRFVDNDFPSTNRIADKREMVVEGQAPFASILSCADSRVIPEFVFVQGIGQLFVTRVAGNYPDDLVTGSIEYAIEQLGTTVILVLGHEGCGAVKAVYSTLQKKEELPPASLIDPAVDRAGDCRRCGGSRQHRAGHRGQRARGGGRAAQQSAGYCKSSLRRAHTRCRRSLSLEDRSG